MSEVDIYDYLKKTSIIDLIELIAQRNNININEKENVDTYYTAKDLFRLYPNVFSKYKLDKFIKEENLPVIKDGKDRLFLKSSVEAWLQSRSQNQYGRR